jgi:hypothetical protein
LRSANRRLSYVMVDSPTEELRHLDMHYATQST